MTDPRFNEPEASPRQLAVSGPLHKMITVGWFIAICVTAVVEYMASGR